MQDKFRIRNFFRKFNRTYVHYRALLERKYQLLIILYTFDCTIVQMSCQMYYLSDCFTLLHIKIPKNPLNVILVSSNKL